MSQQCDCSDAVFFRSSSLLPWVQLDETVIPGESVSLRLMQRGQEYSINLGTNVLMNNRLFGSEELLATRACDLLAARPRQKAPPAMLIGGLGMGFTLRAALAHLPADTQVNVAELIPAVIAWAKGPLAPVFGDSLSDPRVVLRQGDVTAVIAEAPARYDAILLDVDNGPEALTRATNDGLYGYAGLAAAHRALTPGGVLAVWSSNPDPAFTRRLAGSGFTAEEVRTRARGKRGARHLLWFATKKT
jgi:spermidine synthase